METITVNWQERRITAKNEMIFCLKNTVNKDVFTEEYLMGIAESCAAWNGFEKAGAIGIYVDTCNQLIKEGFWKDCGSNDKDFFVKTVEVEKNEGVLSNVLWIVEEGEGLKQGYETNEVRLSGQIANIDGVEYYCHKEIYRNNRASRPIYTRFVYAPFCSLLKNT